MTTTEKCPNCEGFCCRADSGITVEHRVNKHTRHICPGCNDGTVPEPVWTAERAAERAAVVAFVHARIGMYDGELRSDEAVVRALQYLADEIERGEHRREGDK
jgi:hypothetical protein